jgi:hypothetical protein
VSEIRPGSGNSRFEATYREGSPHSYYRDLVGVSAPQLGKEDPESRERLARHRREIKTARSTAMSREGRESDSLSSALHTRRLGWERAADIGQFGRVSAANSVILTNEQPTLTIG